MTDPTSVALSRLQDQVRRRVDRAVRQVGQQYLQYAKLVIRNNPGSPAEAVLYRPDVMQALDEALRQQHRQVNDLVSAGYQAAMKLGQSGLAAQYKELGYEPPAVDLQPTPYLAAVLADVDRSFDRAKTHILLLAAAAYRGVQAPASYRQQPGGTTNVSTATGRIRALAVAAAVERALQGLTLSGRSAGSVLVSRGLNEIQQSSYTKFQQEHPTLRLGKQWHTHSADPCDMCVALDGTVVPVDAQFSHTATTGRLIPVYRDLYTCPRHPNCCCSTVIVILDSTGVEPAQLAA